MSLEVLRKMLPANEKVFIWVNTLKSYTKGVKAGQVGNEEEKFNKLFMILFVLQLNVNSILTSSFSESTSNLILIFYKRILS